MAAAVALVVTGCTPGGPVYGGRFAGEQAGTIAWRPCPDTPVEVLGDLFPRPVIRQLTRDARYDCATIQVPVNWDEPDGDTFDIALLRIRHPDQEDRIGSLLVNPGGPGASGVDHAVLLSLLAMTGEDLTELFTRFDVIGFDPRGVGRSSPVRCTTDEELDESFGADPGLEGMDVEEELAEQVREFEECYEKYGDLLTYYSTHQTARDMDAIRAALGEEKLTYLGYSYGTLLGAVYAHLYPDRIRAMVLDGPIDPSVDIVTDTRATAEGFERAYQNFIAWCETERSSCPIFVDPHGAITRALEEARENPATWEGRRAEVGWVFLAVAAALYAEDAWPQLAAAIDRLLTDRDPREIFWLADLYAERSPDGTYSNLWDANKVITCADRRDEVPVEQVLDLYEQWRSEMPMFGGPVALGMLSCTGWPAAPDPYPVGKAVGAPPILIVGTTGDPATPYEQAEKLAEVLGVGVTLIYHGNGHTAYPGHLCVDRVVEAYLVNLEVPEDGRTCG